MRACAAIADHILAAYRLHGNHVLSTRERQLEHFEEGLADALAGLDARAEREEDQVPPRYEERYGPRGKPQDEEP